MAKKRAAEGTAKNGLLGSRRQREPLPLCYQVPTIKIRREWLYFSDSLINNPHSQENIVFEIDSVWRLLSESSEPLDSNEFWGPTAEYYHDGWDDPRDMYRGETGHPMIAIANYRLIEKTLSDLLPRLKATTNPRNDVLLTMFREALGPYGTDAWHIAYHQKDDARAIQFLEEKRREVATLLKPTMLMFFASLAASREKAAAPASTTDQDRWRFAKPLREKTPPIKWRIIANLYQIETGEPVDEQSMKQSCHRAKTES